MTDRLSPNTAIKALLDSRPQAAAVFLRRRMACVGCQLARFDTLADAATTYRLPLSQFLKELAEA